MSALVIAENEDLVWLEKPAGLPVFRPHKDPTGDCILGRLLKVRPEQGASFPDGFEGGILHRLDVSTSGVVLACKHPDRFARFRGLFTQKELEKSYLFLTHREVRWSENTIDRPLAHHKTKKKRMTVKRGETTPHRGKWYPACTSFRHIEGPLWEAVIQTGVTHQIRAHAAFAGLALAGDRIYGGHPLEVSPKGVDFALHHRGMTGGGLPEMFSNPPSWWHI